MFDFARGHPNSSLLPIEETCCVLKDLCRETGGAQEALWQALQYGNDEGNTSFLAELKAFLSRHTRNDDFGALGVSSTRTEDETKTNFFVTSGVSHGIELLCATQTRPGDVVLVERPTYFLAGGIFRTHGLVVRGLPMRKSTGDLNVDKLLELVENGTMEAPRMIYIIPTHQNPTAHTMDIGDRIKLATFARRHGVLVVSDEVYHLLDWRDSESDGPRPAGMASISSKLHDIVDTSSHGECVSVSSFTKIFAPGIRLGWVEASPGTIKSLSNYGYIQSQVSVVHTLMIEETTIVLMSD
jgi:DNA-binding transcriptional MocR family regulator